VKRSTIARTLQVIGDIPIDDLTIVEVMANGHWVRLAIDSHPHNVSETVVRTLDNYLEHGDMIALTMLLQVLFRRSTVCDVSHGEMRSSHVYPRVPIPSEWLAASNTVIGLLLGQSEYADINNVAVMTPMRKDAGIFGAARIYKFSLSDHWNQFNQEGVIDWEYKDD
jgi:hypothetical protein